MVKIIGEIGINHQGDLDIAKKLIDGAIFAGCDAVKFQKRTVDTVYTPEYLDSPRESPWGNTQRDLKEHLEFGRKEYDEIDDYCDEKIDWFASAWDIDSLIFLDSYNLPYNKIASPMLTNLPFVRSVAGRKKYTFISTGMSDMKEIEWAIEVFEKVECPFELMHCVSVYNMPVNLANLRVIETLRDKFEYDVGYSGHEQTIIIACAAVALGATSIEKHITLDHAMYGSDHGASVEIDGLCRMVKYIRAIEEAMGDGEKVILNEELENIKKLRYFKEETNVTKR